MSRGLQLIYRMILVQAKWSSQSNQHGTKGLQLSERCCIAHLCWTPLVYLCREVHVTFDGHDHDNICYWCNPPKLGNSNVWNRLLRLVWNSGHTWHKKDKGDDFWEAWYPSSKGDSKNKLLKLSYQSSMACKCQLVSWTLSCFVAVRMKTIQSEKSTTRAASTGLMVWKQTVQGAGGKQWGPSTLTPLQACLMLQQQKAAVTRVDPLAAQSYSVSCRSPSTGV